MLGSSLVRPWFVLGSSLVFDSVKTGKGQGKEILRKRLLGLYKIVLSPSDSGGQRVVVGIGGVIHTAIQRAQLARSEYIIDANTNALTPISGSITTNTALCKAITHAQIHSPIDQRDWQGIEIA